MKPPVIHVFTRTVGGRMSIYRNAAHVCEVPDENISGPWLCAVLDSAYLAGAADVGKAVRTAIGIRDE